MSKMRASSQCCRSRFARLYYSVHLSLSLSHTHTHTKKKQTQKNTQSRFPYCRHDEISEIRRSHGHPAQSCTKTCPPTAHNKYLSTPCLAICYKRKFGSEAGGGGGGCQTRGRPSAFPRAAAAPCAVFTHFWFFLLRRVKSTLG